MEVNSMEILLIIAIRHLKKLKKSHHVPTTLKEKQLAPN
jgi:hypothetical protein